jgi:hypothetical protein
MHRSGVSDVNEWLFMLKKEPFLNNSWNLIEHVIKYKLI